MSFSGNVGGNYLYQSGGGTMVDNSHDFNRLAQTLGQNVTKIQQNSQKIKGMSSRMNNAQDSGKLGEEQVQLIHYTKQLVQETNSQVKDLNRLATEAASDSERKQRRMQKDRLVEKFTTTVNEFKEVQLRATETQKACVQRARLHSMQRASNATPASSDTNLIDIRASPSDDSFDPLEGANKLQQQQQLQQQKQAQIAAEEEENLTIIRQREQDILQLEGDIGDLNQIYKDLGMMVHEQGEVIDSIEAHVETAAVHVEEGNTHLGTAEQYQRKARKKKIILAFIALAALIVIILIIYFSVKSDN